MIRAVIFDMDGVIIDSESLWLDIESAFFQHHGKKLTEGIRAELMGKNGRTWGAIVQQHLNIPDDPAVFVPKIIREYHARIEEVHLNAGYHELMQTIRDHGLRRGLATGAGHQTIRRVLAQFKIANDFEVIVSCDDVPLPKPAPDVYLAAAKYLGVLPKECVVIEDAPNGIRAAKAAGMKCIAVPNPHLSQDHPAFQEADLRRTSIAEITADDLLR